jgi:tape measure domain-containing protein
MAEKVGEIFFDVTLETGQMIDGSRKVTREIDKLVTKFTAVAAAAAVMAAALAAVKIANLADEFRLLGARVEVAAGSVEAGGVAMAELTEISKRTQSSLAGNIEVFARLNQSLKQMGGTQADTLQMTELLAKAIKVSGASAVEAKSAMLQFGQALGSGKLAGDELRALLETAPYLMRQLADGIGVPVGALKKMGEEGKLTADVVANALTKAAATIDADFKKFPQTIESAMVVARDQAALAALKFDELSGSSAILTGAAKGLGEVLEQTAAQFGAMAGQADKLSRNDQVNTWAGITRLALSYVADAADVTWQALSVLGRNVKFVFEGIGREIGGIASQIAVFFEDGDPLRFTKAKWDKFHGISDAMRADAARARQELDKADAETLSRTGTMGQRMRNVWAMGDMGQNDPRELARRGRGPATPSKLTAPAGATDTKGSKFDAEGYLAGLEKVTLEGVARVDAIEREGLRKNAELLAAGKINRAQAAQAVNLIEAEAAQQRQDIALTEAETRRGIIEKMGEDEAAAAKLRGEQQAKDLALAREIQLADDPIGRLQFELQTKSALLTEAAERDRANEELYAAARVALEDQTSSAITAIRVQQYAAFAGTLDSAANAVAGFAGKQNAAYKAMFAASKAFAIAESAIKIQQGIANAASLPYPANLVAIGTVIAATASIVSTIRGTNYGGGRLTGGPASAGSTYRVNESGAPEMFVGANGRQYMMPTQAGNVVPADGLGGGKAPTIIIQNMGTPQQVESQSYDQGSNTATLVMADLVDQFSNNSGPAWSALTRSSNVQGRM